MSKKHHQRTRAEILARRSAPSMLPAPTVTTFAGNRAAAEKHIADQRFTAGTRRAMRSRYMPHDGGGWASARRAA